MGSKLQSVIHDSTKIHDSIATLIFLANKSTPDPIQLSSFFGPTGLTEKNYPGNVLKEQRSTLTKHRKLSLHVSAL